MCCSFDWDRIRGKMPPQTPRTSVLSAALAASESKKSRPSLTQLEQMGGTAEEQSAVHGEERLGAGAV